MFCEKCGEEIIAGSKFCSKCGTPIHTMEHMNPAGECNNDTNKDTMPPQNEYAHENKHDKKKSVKIGIACGVGAVAVIAIAFGIVFWNNQKADVPQLNENEVIKEAQNTYPENDENKAGAPLNEKEDQTGDATENPEISMNLDSHIKQAYADVITSFYYRDWEKCGLYGENVPDYDCDIDMEYNTYAIVDINNDGKEELIISNNGAGYSAAMASYIFSYDEKLGKAVRWDAITSVEPMVFEGGYIGAVSMHFDSLGDAFLPYSVYSCSDMSLTDTGYLVSSWNSQYAEEDDTGTFFPYEIDSDGDGIVYTVTDYFSGDTCYYELDELKQWLESNCGSYTEVTWLPLTLEEAQALCNEYALSYQQELSKLNTPTTTDLAYLYISGEDIVEAAKDNISFIKETSDSPVYLGSKDGIQAIKYESLDAGAIRYSEKAIPGVTLLGVQPGDTIDKAVEKLNKYGFYDAVNWNLQGYINGYTWNSYRIDVEVQDGKVYGISISSNHQYAG